LEGVLSEQPRGTEGTFDFGETLVEMDSRLVAENAAGALDSVRVRAAHEVDRGRAHRQFEPHARAGSTG
jgi:hypothetical protein